MNSLEYVLGEACRILLPIPDEVHAGNPDSDTALCTLSSMHLLAEIVRRGVLERVAVAGRLLSENRGIDALIASVNANPRIRTVILCGSDARGHMAGHSLLKLCENGVDDRGRIVESASPDPVLHSSCGAVERFRREVTVVDRIGMTDPADVMSIFAQ